MLKRILPAILPLLLTACGTIGHEIKVVDTACEWTKPIYVSKADIITDETAKQILAHNETGRLRCGWKRSTPSKP